MNGNPIESALKQIQTWFVNGEFEKVKQGCEEVLGAAPNNSIAQDLLQKANEALGQGEETPVEASVEATPPEPTPPPMETEKVIETAPAQELPAQDAMPEPEIAPSPVEIPGMIPDEPAEKKPAAETPETAPSSFADDLPQPENEPPIPETINPEESDPTEEPIHEEEEHHKLPSMVINILILVLLIALGIGGVYGYQALFGDTKQEETTPIIEEKVIEEEVEEDDGKGEKAVEEETETVEEVIEEEEKQDDDTVRVNDLTRIENTLLNYYDEYKQYPGTDEINNVLLEELLSIPADPSGAAYYYAVYDSDLGPKQVYILSAELENDEVWATGGNTLEYTDYRDLEQEHVTILDAVLSEEDYLEWIEIFELSDEIMETIDDFEEYEENTTEDTEETNVEEEKERVPRI